MPGESKTSPRRLAAAERQRQALELRKAGVSFDLIAQQLGYSNRQGAHFAVESALQKTLQKPGDDLRQLDIERLDSLLFAVWPDARRGSLDHIDAALKILTRRAKLLGLDAPVKTELTGPDGGPIELAAVMLTQKLQRIVDAEVSMPLGDGKALDGFRLDASVPPAIGGNP